MKPTSSAEPMIQSWFPKQVLNCAQKLFRVQRLLQQRALAGSRCDGKLIRQARHDDRRYVWISPRDVLACRPTVLARHVEVQKQQINRLREEAINGFNAISGEGHVVVSFLQELLQSVSDRCVIIHNQNALFHDSFALNRVHPRSGTADYSAGGAGVVASTWQQAARWQPRLSLFVAVEHNRPAKFSVLCRTRPD